MVLGSMTFKGDQTVPRSGRSPVRGKLSSGLKASPAVVEMAPAADPGVSTTSVERSSGQRAKRLLAIVEEPGVRRTSL